MSGLQGKFGERLSLSDGNRLLVQAAVDNLDEVVVYPNPYRAAETTQPLMFANLPPQSEVHIYNANGMHIHRLGEVNAFGGMSWDLRTKNGNFVGSGVYIYIVRYQDQERIGKLVLVR